MVVFFLCGKMGVGKNYVADRIALICARKGLVCEQFMLAQGVKQGCEEDFSRLAELLNEYAEEARSAGLPDLADKLTVRKANWWEKKTAITRTLLQTYGTEIFRNRVSENYWTDRLVDKLAVLDEDGPDVALVTDMRFPNEYSYPKERLSHIPMRSVLVKRKSCYNNKALFNHDSETALEGFASDVVLVNDNDAVLDEGIVNLLGEFFKEN